MKLVLANNQSDKFVQFHEDLQANKKIYDYAGYDGLLFHFEAGKSSFVHVDTRRQSSDYTGVYLNGYLTTPEIAATAATVLGSNGIRYVNSELDGVLSLSKLSAYAKLAASDVSIPKTYGGAARALIRGLKEGRIDLSGRFVLKRADADRGIDNFLLDTQEEVLGKLQLADDRSLWLIQEFIPNDGFYLVSFYHGEPRFGIYRTLEERPDGNRELGHMYKPAGGINAVSCRVEDIPKPVLAQAATAIKSLRREIGSVDVVVDSITGEAYVLEVNYNPQLVTISTFTELRRQAFLDAIDEL